MAGTALAAGVLTVAATLSLGLAAVGGAAVTAQRTAGAADAAALAAADTALGFASGVPCERAAEVVSQARLTLIGCDVDGVTVTVEAAAVTGVFRVHARARAGPPPAHSG